MKVQVTTKKTITEDLDLIVYEVQTVDETEIIAATNFTEVLNYMIQDLYDGLDDLFDNSEKMQVRQIPIKEVNKMKIFNCDTGKNVMGKTIIKRELKDGYNGAFLISTTNY